MVDKPKGKSHNGKNNGSKSRDKPDNGESVSQLVERLYNEASELASGDAGGEKSRKQAKELEDQLQALLPRIQAAQISDKAAVMEMWARALVSARQATQVDEAGGKEGGRNLQSILDELNSKALQLAKEAAEEKGNAQQRKEKARELNSRLDELWPQVQNAPANVQTALNQAWSDARLDLGYVMADGSGPSSIRLFHYLQDKERKE